MLVESTKYNLNATHGAIVDLKLESWKAKYDFYIFISITPKCHEPLNDHFSSFAINHQTIIRLLFHLRE